MKKNSFISKSKPPHYLMICLFICGCFYSIYKRNDIMYFTEQNTAMQVDSFVIEAECYHNVQCGIESFIISKQPYYLESIQINLLHGEEFAFLFRSSLHPKSYEDLLLSENYILLICTSLGSSDTILLDSCKTLFYYQNDANNGLRFRIIRIATELQGYIVLKKNTNDSISGTIDFTCRTRSDYSKYDMQKLNGHVAFDTNVKKSQNMKKEIYKLLMPFGMASRVTLYDLNRDNGDNP